MRSSCAAECLLQPRFAQIGQVPLTILRSFPVFKATRLFHGDSGIELQDRIKKTGTLNGTEFLQRTTAMGPAPLDLDEIRRVREATPVVGLEMFNVPNLKS